MRCETTDVFNSKPKSLWAGNLLRTIKVLGAVIFFGMLIAPTFVQAQRLCENNDNPVATISPCLGAAGTTVSIKPGRKLASAPGTLIFKRVLANGVPSQITAPVSGDNTVSSPPQLCIAGGGRWEVWLVLANGQSQGKIGAFWPADCANRSSNGAGNAGNDNNSSGGNNNGNNKNNGNNNSSKEKPKSPKGGDGGGQGATGKIDPCLVGEWEVSSIDGAVKGGAGFRLTIKKDGTQIADYSAMQVLALQELTYRYGGISEGVLAAENGTAKNISITNAGATLATGYGGRENPAKSTQSMGPGALGINKNDNSYTCTDKTLKFITEDYRGKVFLDIAMKRLR